MAAKKMVEVKEFCIYHNISRDVIMELHQHELIELVIIDRKKYIPEKHLPSLEKALRLYSDLDINIQGIQTILHLLSSIEQKDAELTALRNQLQFYIS